MQQSSKVSKRFTLVRIEAVLFALIQRTYDKEDEEESSIFNKVNLVRLYCVFTLVHQTKRYISNAVIAV